MNRGSRIALLALGMLATTSLARIPGIVITQIAPS
jgi:hypothetical protein